MCLKPVRRSSLHSSSFKESACSIVLSRSCPSLKFFYSPRYIRPSVYLSVCLYVCMYVCMYLCVCMCMCMHVCMYMCMCVCFYTCIYARIYMCTIHEIELKLVCKYFFGGKAKSFRERGKYVRGWVGCFKCMVVQANTVLNAYLCFYTF